ncbi:MAG: hypothetical protein RSD00_03175 [Bacilli bacterium]
MKIKVGKKEIYPFVYKRIWDLTQFDSIKLKKYDLEKALYIYIGSSAEYNVVDRCSRFRNSILNNRSNVAKHTREFISNLKKFYELETNYTVKEIENLLYYNADVIARSETIAGARKLEKHFTSKYHHLDFFGEILEEHTILLSKVDSGLKEIKNNGVSIVELRK